MSAPQADPGSKEIPLTEQQLAASAALSERMYVRGAIRVTVNGKADGPPAIGGYPLPPEPRE